MRALVDDGKLAGVTALVARHGKVVYLDAYGVQDLATKKPVASDTIFRIASMTKRHREFVRKTATSGLHLTTRSWFSATGPGFESPYRYQQFLPPRGC
jgi:Beta-lactamase